VTPSSTPRRGSWSKGPRRNGMLHNRAQGSPPGGICPQAGGVQLTPLLSVRSLDDDRPARLSSTEAWIRDVWSQRSSPVQASKRGSQAFVVRNLAALARAKLWVQQHRGKVHRLSDRVSLSEASR